MKIRKKLEDMAETSRSEYRNEEFEKALIEKMACKNAKAKRKSFKAMWIAVASSLVVVLLVVSLVLFIPNSSEKVYFEEDIVNTEAKINDISSYLNGNTLLNTNLWNVTRYYDSKSGDTLFYVSTLADDESALSLKLVIIVNPYYSYKTDTKEYENAAIVKGFNWKYNYTVDGDEVYSVSVNGKAEFDDVKLYVEYTQLTFDSSDNFSQVLASIFD